MGFIGFMPLMGSMPQACAVCVVSVALVLNSNAASSMEVFIV
jgi:hypothetical protein